MTRFLFDTAVFVYALGRAHPYRDSCVELVRAATRGQIRGEASVDLVQELLHVRSRRGGDRREATERARDVGELCVLHTIEPADLERAFDLFVAHGALGARDAVFASVALNRDVGIMLSPDRHFDGIPGLERLDPLDPNALERLAA